MNWTLSSRNIFLCAAAIFIASCGTATFTNVENQKRALRVFVDSQPAQEQERAEKLTLHVLEIAATKVVPILIAMI